MFRWFALLLAITSCLVSPAQAQRGDLVEDLLKSLVESQLDRIRPPVTTVPPGNRPDPALRNVRNEVQGMSDDVLQLTRAIQSESRQLPQLRTPLSRLIQLAAQLDQLNRFPPTSLGAYQQSYGTVNRDWRQIEFQLLQTFDLSQRSQQLVDAVSSHDRTLLQLLSIQPQLDRNELVRLGGELNSSFRQLIEDIQLELRRNPQFIGILQQGQQLQLQVRQATALLDRAGYDQLVNEYRRAQTSWRAYVQRLQPIATDRIRRSIFRVEQAGRAIQELLWIPFEQDVALVPQLAVSLQTEVEQLLSNITLQDLVLLTQPTTLLQSARELQQTSRSFAQSAATTTDRNTLLWDFRLVDVQWQSFQNSCRMLNNPGLQQQLIQVDSLMSMLRQALGSQSGNDYRHLLQLVARVDELTLQFQQTAQQRVLNTGLYDRNFRIQFADSLEKLHQSAHSLHDELSGFRPGVQANALMRELIRHWNACKSRIPQCRPEHQQVLYQSVAQLEPLLVTLQIELQ